MEHLTVLYFPYFHLRFNYGIIIDTDIEGDNLRRELVDIVQVKMIRSTIVGSFYYKSFFFASLSYNEKQEAFRPLSVFAS